jgi:ribosomal protein L7/L12
MKLTLTQDEIKNHYRVMFNLDQSDEIEIENFVTTGGGEHVSIFDSELSELNRKIYDLVSNDHLIPAIKLVRNLTMWGLKESKDFVVQGRKLSHQDIRITFEDAIETCRSVNLNG